MEQFAAQVDVRKFAPKDKQPMIFKTFDGLKPGEKMELINDHDPSPLRYKFMAELPEKFEWNYLEEGPEVWRVAIEKRHQ